MARLLLDSTVLIDALRGRDTASRVAGLRRESSLWPDRHAPAGDGRAVVLLNGFGMPPATLNPLARWLRAGGWAVHVAPTGWNLDCGESIDCAEGDCCRQFRAEMA